MAHIQSVSKMTKDPSYIKTYHNNKQCNKHPNAAMRHSLATRTAVQPTLDARPDNGILQHVVTIMDFQGKIKETPE